MDPKAKTSHADPSCVNDENDGDDSNTAENLVTSLSDVSLYSLSGLVAVSLIQLYEEECHKDFRKKTLEKFLKKLKQPKQVLESMMTIIEGEVMNDSSAFVDTLNEEECLKSSRQPVVFYLISLAISDGYYDARVRMLIKHIAWQLRVTWDQMEEIETDLAESLEYNTYVMTEEEAAEKAKKAKSRKLKRYALIGLATVGGGALIGLTGGLAAPLVAAGAGVIIGGAGAAALGTTAGVAIIGSLFGVAGAGLTGYKMKKRVGAIEEFAFEPLTSRGSRLMANNNVKQLHITLAVTGWISDKNPDFRTPWRALAESKEQYCLRWESKYLYQLGEAFDYLLQTGLSMATTEALKYTVLSGLIAAVAWPAALISASGVIDNPWHVCTQRSVAVGKQLAEVLLAREQGNRPVSLIGFSMGARVIFYCLEELSKRKGGEGLIEDVILLGAPVSGDPNSWMPFSKIVAGKIVNGYSRGDWLLKFLFRTANVKLTVAGLGPVKWDNRRMHNIDLTDVIDGHGDYLKNIDIIMKAVGVRTKDELKPSVPKSGSKSCIPKSTSNDIAAGVTNGVQQINVEEKENRSNEDKELKTNANLDIGNCVSPSSSTASGISSVDEGHASGLDNVTEMDNLQSLNATKKTNRENSVDFTSSESDRSSKELTPEQEPKIIDQETEKKQGEEAKVRKALRVEDEIKEGLIKSKGTGDTEGGMDKSESCYFTDSDPEGED